MNNLFDNTDKFILSEEYKIKNVLNPFNKLFIDEQKAKELGIIFNGYYRNNYGGLIPIHIAASKGFIQYEINNQIEIEYRSRQNPIKINLILDQVYDNIHQCMIPCRQAIDKGYLNLKLFTYLSMEIHEAFYRGLIIGQLRTNITQSSKSLIYKTEKKRDLEYDNLFSTLTNIINSLSEFRNTINIIDECELTSDGYIKHKQTGKCYLLTQAIENKLISIKDISIKNQMDYSKNDTTVVNDIIPSDMDISYTEDEKTIPYFSDTFILDLLKPTSGGSLMDEVQKQFLPVMNTC